MLSQYRSSKKNRMTYDGYSGVKEEKFHYKWTIEKFELCLSKKNLSSPDSLDRRKGDLLWYLQFQRHPGPRSNELLSLMLCLKDKSSAMYARIKVSTLSKRGYEAEILYDQSEVHLVKPNSPFTLGDWDYTSFCEHEDFILPNGTLILFCELTVLDFVEKCSPPPSVEMPECCLSKDLENVFEVGKFCDITLLVDGREFQAHKTILSGRSPVFAAMFDHEFAESKQNCVTIPDVDHEVFEEILRFMYTGRAKKIESMADKLLIAADKYALERLKVLCEEVLSYNISIDNVCDFLVLADKHNANQLKVQTTKFIKNNFAKVKSTDGWKNTKDTDPLVLMATFENFNGISLG